MVDELNLIVEQWGNHWCNKYCGNYISENMLFV